MSMLCDILGAAQNAAKNSGLNLRVVVAEAV
jgi:hypothetical protein